MPHELPALPWEKTALEPHISSETIEYHYGKHHAGYVNKLNAAIGGTPYADRTLEDLVKSTSGGVFNNASQAWNHTFYWHCMKPEGGGRPSGARADAINAAFGNIDKFKEAFSAAAATQFGSGWTWLCKDNAGALKIVQTANAGNPLTDGLTPLLTIDVWEHAYYIDFHNARPGYIATFLDKLVNWDYVASRFA